MTVRDNGRVLRSVAAGCALLAVSLLGGCGDGVDDELPQPPVTVTASPEPPRSASRLPVGRGPVRPGSEVRVQGSRVVVGGESVDLGPLRVDDWVVVPGGIFFLNQGELWFTDLQRARPTAYQDVSDLDVASGGDELTFVDHEHGTPDEDGTPRPLEMRYDTRTGEFVGATYAEPEARPGGR